MQIFNRRKLQNIMHKMLLVLTNKHLLKNTKLMDFLTINSQNVPYLLLQSRSHLLSSKLKIFVTSDDMNSSQSMLVGRGGKKV